jgi:hypothetical protein
MSRFVRPDTTVLALTAGDTITVKMRLNAGERRDLYARLYTPGLDGKLHVNQLQTGLTVMTAYLVDWSLRDDDGAKVEIRGLSIKDLEAVLNSLDSDSFGEIKRAIETHEEGMEAARAEEKKRQAGSSGDEAISASPSAAAGVLAGSVN